MEVSILASAYYEDGICFYYGYREGEGKLYRWEPVATRLRQGEAGSFRRKAAGRAQMTGETLWPAGILPVTGPVSHQGETLIGWEARAGEPLFSVFPPRLPPEQGVHFLLPLLHSYQAYHRRGQIVGCPDWYRISLGATGIFMPDPFLLSYLGTPRRSLPPGVAGCHPPESYTGKPLDQRGDLFYLGLLCYLVVTGHLPYPLIRGWPTEALRQGVIIPPARYRPDLPVTICRDLERFLAVNPEGRPDAEEVIDRWRKPTTTRFFVGREKKGRVGSWREKGRLYYRLYRRRWGKTALLLAGLLLLFSWWPMKGVRDGDPSPLPAEGVAVLLGELADPGLPQAFLPGRPEIWTDLQTMKEERRKAAAALLTHPLLAVEKVTPLSQESNRAEVEVDLVWYHWREGRWETVASRERIKLVREGDHWEIIGRQRVD